MSLSPEVSASRTCRRTRRTSLAIRLPAISEDSAKRIVLLSDGTRHWAALSTRRGRGPTTSASMFQHKAHDRRWPQQLLLLQGEDR